MILPKRHLRSLSTCVLSCIASATREASAKHGCFPPCKTGCFPFVFPLLLTHTAQTMNANSVITSSPDILGGSSVFAGTRVPVKTLIDSLEAGDSIDLFLYDFPSVARKQVVAFLEMTKEKLLAPA